jgi:hypothetical protein
VTMGVEAAEEQEGWGSLSTGAVLSLVLTLCLVLVELSLLSSPAAPSPISTASLSERRMLCSSQPPSLDYLEIGTSDFGTILQAVDALVGTPGFPLREPLRGVSVDAVPVYLNALPTQAEHHRKLNFAVTGIMPHPPALPVYFLEPGDIASHGLPDWLRGCNRVGEPHPLALETLPNWGGKDLMGLLKKVDVPVMSIPELILHVGACRLSTLKIDVEGLDAELILSYVAFLWANPQCRADILLFEARNLGRHGKPEADYPRMFDAVDAALRSVGYAAAFNPLGPQGYPVRDAYWVWSAARDSRLWAAKSAADAAAAARFGALVSAQAAVSYVALDDGRVEGLMAMGKGSEEPGEWDNSAAQADAAFTAACSAPVPPPEWDVPQGRTPNGTEALRYIVSQVIRRRRA